MKYLVTGGAGFIGSHVVQKLQAGNEIVVVDVFADNYDPQLKRNNAAGLSQYSNVKIKEGDICDNVFLEKIFGENKFDAVIHLAARPGVRQSIIDPFLYYHVNVDGTLNIYEQVRKHGIKKVVFASSSSVYGENSQTPFFEDQAIRPISPYAATKKAGEDIAFLYHHLYGIDSICLRFFTAYGEGGRPDMAPWLFTEAILTGKPINQYGDGTSQRDYTYVGDIANGVMLAVKKLTEQKYEGFEVINLGGGCKITLKDFIGLIEELTGKKAIINQLPAQSGDVSITEASIEKAKAFLGYDPRVKVERGLTNFINWYRKNIKYKIYG